MWQDISGIYRAQEALELRTVGFPGKSIGHNNRCVMPQKHAREEYFGKLNVSGYKSKAFSICAEFRTDLRREYNAKSMRYSKT
jgi:hypothetical protein